MPHAKPIRRFNRPRPGINGPLGRYVIRLTGSELPEFLARPETPDLDNKRPQTLKIKGTLSPLKPLTTYYRRFRKRSKTKSKMRMVNIEFRSMDTERSDDSKGHTPPITTTLTFSDYLCKWCLTYVGQRRQFCSADCAAQFKLCQRKRDQKQDLNISVDYYGNVKLSIQGLPISSSEDHGGNKVPDHGGTGEKRRGRRRKRCKNCGKQLPDDVIDEFCDETCETMDGERTKREEFVNVFQQKEIAERRRIRKWLLDAQDQYTKQTEGAEFLLNGERPDHDGFDITSGPAALYPLPVFRTPLPNIVQNKTPKDALTRSGGPSYSFRRHLIHHPIPEKFRLPRDEVVTGGPVTLNPIPIRKGPIRRERNRDMDQDKRQLMVDLKWIPKFFS